MGKPEKQGRPIEQSKKSRHAGACRERKTARSLSRDEVIAMFSERLDSLRGGSIIMPPDLEGSAAD